MSDDQEFTGEYLNKFDVAFKIPLKSSSTNEIISTVYDNSAFKCNIPNNIIVDTPNEVQMSNALHSVINESFSSPLAIYEYDLNQYNSQTTPYYQHVGYNYNSITSGTSALSDLATISVGTKRKHSEQTSKYVLPAEEGLPAELKKLLQPLSCALCNIKMNSNLSAKMHYESKNHDKKINTWLQEWSKKTGEPLLKRQKVNKESRVGPNAFHCDACDISLTSLQHANQHYSGKKHKMVVAGQTNPSGSGYYNDDGKWVRVTTKVNDTSGRFGIGETFKNSQHHSTVNNILETNATSLSSSSSSSSSLPSMKNDSSKYCNICSISVTSDAQMKLHLEGARHTKKLKNIGAPPHTTEDDTIMGCLPGTSNKPSYVKLSKRDNSIYRTPSGNYYCKPCNLTLMTENLFNQHLESKKHIKQSKA